MNNIEYVPLGFASCSISHFLRKKKIRTIAYPFDWLCIPLISFFDLINNDFNNFMDELLFLEKTFGRYFLNDNINKVAISKKQIYPVFCKKYKLLFLHDFLSKDNNHINLIKVKYKRRINRLRELFKSNKEIIFVISKTYNKDIENYYKKLNYNFKNLFKVNNELKIKIIDKIYEKYNKKVKIINIVNIKI